MILLTDTDFEKTISQATLPSIIMFYASWCNKCSMMKPIFEETEKHYKGKISFYEVNVDTSPLLAEKYGADIIPTFLCFKEKRPVSVIQGLISERNFQQYIHKIFRNS